MPKDGNFLMTMSSEAQVAAGLNDSAISSGRVVRGSAVLLTSTVLVAITNLLYNILIARMLGASGFGHACALYTLLMLVTAITLSFQIITSKFIARSSETAVRAQIYASLLRRAWQAGLAIAVLVAAGSAYLKSYFNLPEQHDLVLLAVAAAVYVPLGVQRGRMQGRYHFGGLAMNVVIEVAVKFLGAMLFLHYGMGVTGVMIAVLLSIVAAYLAGGPGSEYRALPGTIKIAPFGESMQAGLYFAGQVIISDLDILMVKHFFPPAEAGIYAAIALVGRVVFMLSWSVVSSMFPVSAATHPQRREGRSVLYTALALVGAVVSIFIAGVALAPAAVWNLLLGKEFLLSAVAPFSSLLTEYAFMTGIYCIAVVVMMYEISRRIGTAPWLQLGASVLMAGGIWRYHHSLREVIVVQLVVMCGLLVTVTIPLFRAQDESRAIPPTWGSLQIIRPVPEEKIVAEFLRGEFYHPVFDPYRQDFQRLVDHPDFDDAYENFIRRTLLFRRRGRLWRELAPGTQWFEIELTANDLSRLRSFPRNEWMRFAGGGFYLIDMVRRIQEARNRGRQTHFLKKLGAIANDLHESHVPDAVLLIGIDEFQALTIIEGNHRMAAAMLSMPESAHRRFRFYCGLSPRMNLCCWHKTDLRSLTRYARHTLRYIHDYIFNDADLFGVLIPARKKLAKISPPERRQ